MLIDRVIGKWSKPAPGDSIPPSDASRIDFLDLAWDECHRRAMQKNTRSGQSVRLLLGVGTILGHHDLLVDSSRLLLVVEVRPIPVLVVRPRSIAESAAIAMEWGNLHVPMEIAEDAVYTLPDGPSEEAAIRHRIPFAIEVRRFQPRRISGINWNVAGGAVVRILTQ